MADTDVIRDSYASWVQDGSPASLGKVVSALEPTINYSLASLNSATDPVMRGEALALTAKAVKTYDPASGAGLHTWVSNNLMGLSRIRRKVQSPVALPERTQMDNAALNRAELEFEDTHGRLPDVMELADRTGLPPKRIRSIRMAARATPSEGAMLDGAGQQRADFSTEAAEMLMQSLPSEERRILDMRLGLSGKPPMQPKEMAPLLKMSPATLSRRSAALALRLHELEETFNQVYAR